MEQLPRIAPYLEFLKQNTHIKIHMSVKRWIYTLRKVQKILLAERSKRPYLGFTMVVSEIFFGYLFFISELISIIVPVHVVLYFIHKHKFNCIPLSAIMRLFPGPGPIQVSGMILCRNYLHWLCLWSGLDWQSLLAFTAKCGVPTNQWTWLCQALLEVSMTTIALWICVCADDWAVELAVKASNDKLLYTISNNIEVYEEPVPRTKKIP